MSPHDDIYPVSCGGGKRLHAYKTPCSVVENRLLYEMTASNCENEVTLLRITPNEKVQCSIRSLLDDFIDPCAQSECPHEKFYSILFGIILPSLVLSSSTFTILIVVYEGVLPPAAF